MTTKVKPSVLADTAVTIGNYGGSTQIPVFYVDQQGRLTYAANVDPSVATTQLTGTLDANQLSNTIVYGVKTNFSGVQGTASATQLSNTIVYGIKTNASSLQGTIPASTMSNTISYGITAAAVPWNGVTGKPNFATVATSGAYGDLSGRVAGFNPSGSYSSGYSVDTTYTNSSGYSIMVLGSRSPSGNFNNAYILVDGSQVAWDNSGSSGYASFVAAVVPNGSTWKCGGVAYLRVFI